MVKKGEVARVMPTLKSVPKSALYLCLVSQTPRQLRSSRSVWDLGRSNPYGKSSILSLSAQLSLGKGMEHESGFGPRCGSAIASASGNRCPDQWLLRSSDGMWAFNVYLDRATPRAGSPVHSRFIRHSFIIHISGILTHLRIA